MIKRDRPATVAFGFNQIGGEYARTRDLENTVFGAVTYRVPGSKPATSERFQVLTDFSLLEAMQAKWLTFGGAREGLSYRRLLRRLR